MTITKHAFSSRFLAFLAISCAIAVVARVSGDVTVLLLLLTVLLVYLGRDMLFSWSSDRILLARYLVLGLIVASFDLRTRRNVLGTLVLASLLLVLLSEVGFDLWFPILLGGFVLLALAAATLGHSEEEAAQGIIVGGGRLLAASRVWVVFVVAFLLLAGAIFLVMPRFGLGGLTQAIWLPSRIDLTAGGSGRLPSLPSAGVSSDILVSQQSGGTGAGTYVGLGYVGSAADAVVMHVRSRISSYWRGYTLNEYDGAGWLPSALTLKRPEEGRGELAFSDSSNRKGGRGRYSQMYYLMVDQPNAVFTGYNPGRIYLPEADQLVLRRGTVYRAVSQIPRLSPGLLRRDRVDARDVENLILPPISDRVAALARSIVQGVATDYDRAAWLEQFFLRNYRYDLSVDPLTPGRDAVEVFLFEKQAGYCAQFATTMAVMARAVGLPARVAVGYLPGLYSPLTGAYRVRAGDAHAWVEIHFRNSGWVAFDPTPRPDAFLGAGIGQGWVSFGLVDLVGGRFTGAVSSLSGDWFPGSFSMPGWGLLGVIGGIAVAGIMAFLRVSRRRSGIRPDAKGYTLLAGESRQRVLKTYLKMVALLAKKGLPKRHPAQTPREYAGLVGSRLTSGRDVVEWLTEAATTAAYDPNPFSPSIAEEARAKLAELPRALAIRAG